MTTQSITIERRMSPNRFVAVYKEVDGNGTTQKRYEEDIGIAVIEGIMGIPKGA